MKLFLSLIIILFVVAPAKSYSQLLKPFPGGLGIEVGDGLNNFLWSAQYGPDDFGFSPVDRTDF